MDKISFCTGNIKIGKNWILATQMKYLLISTFHINSQVMSLQVTDLTSVIGVDKFGNQQARSIVKLGYEAEFGVFVSNLHTWYLHSFLRENE